MTKYTVELTDDEYKILSYYHNPEHWVSTLFKHRARVAIEEMFKEEIQLAVATGKIVPANKEEAILASELPAMVDVKLPAEPPGAEIPPGVDQ